jgi:ABC-type Fe3+-siderophore transport system permease subunit
MDQSTWPVFAPEIFAIASWVAFFQGLAILGTRGKNRDQVRWHWLEGLAKSVGGALGISMVAAWDHHNTSPSAPGANFWVLMGIATGLVLVGAEFQERHKP